MATNLSQKAYERKLQYDAAYDAANTTRVAIKLNNKTDRDILDYLDSLPNKQGYIKELIRKDMGNYQKRTEDNN